MKKLGKTQLRKYVEEYIQYGIQCGFFDHIRAKKLKKKLLNLEVVIYDNIDGDALYEGNTLHINRKIFEKSDNGKFASLVLFHEFTHVCSDIHTHIFNNGLIVKLRDYIEAHPERINTTYQHGFATTKMGDVDNPYTYIIYGGLLIDEVTAEHVAIEMVKKKYKQYVLPKNGQRVYGDGRYIHKYKSHFDYYGVGEELIEKFSKTLFLKNNCKNLNGLAAENFKERFVYDLIRQHNENPTAFKHLIDELAFLGVIGLSEEQHNGRRLNQKSPSVSLIRDSYESLQEILEYGREDRENIPNNITVPPFME